MHDNYFTVKALVFMFTLAISTNLFLSKLNSSKLQTMFFVIYGYLIWAMLVASGSKFWLASASFYDSSFINAFALGWLVFIALYAVLFKNRKISWPECLITILICLPLITFFQIWTGFIYTCAGYGDCL